jgi:holo-[acyl-carrier protein] synthase
MKLILSTGIDLEEIGRLRKLPIAIKARFIQRILTSVEQDTFDLNDQTLTGLYCAKEAVAKALGCGIGPVSWHEIEIMKDEQAAPIVYLNGKAHDLAISRGIQHWSVSISHTRSYATACAVGYGEG